MMYMRYDTLCDLTQIITAVLTRCIIKYIKIIQVYVYVSDMKASLSRIVKQLTSIDSFPSTPPKTKYIKIACYVQQTG